MPHHQTRNWTIFRIAMLCQSLDKGQVNSSRRPLLRVKRWKLPNQANHASQSLDEAPNASNFNRVSSTRYLAQASNLSPHSRQVVVVRLLFCPPAASSPSPPWPRSSRWLSQSQSQWFTSGGRFWSPSSTISNSWFVSTSVHPHTVLSVCVSLILITMESWTLFYYLYLMPLWLLPAPQEPRAAGWLTRNGELPRGGGILIPIEQI